MRTLNKLTAKQVAQAKPRTALYTLADGGGLILQVQPTGSRWWRFRYRYFGIERMLSLGTYPDTDLKSARDKRDTYRKLLAADPPIDPSERRRIAKAARADCFKAVSDSWFLEMQSGKAPSTRKRNRHVLNLLVEHLGSQSVSTITTASIQRTIRSIQKRNGVEMAHRALGRASNVFAYAIALGSASEDPTRGLKASLKENVSRPRAAITDAKLFGQLLRDIDHYNGQRSTQAALKLLALNFTRPSEIRLGKWPEIDFDKKVWIIPAARMKMRNRNPCDHLVPLSDQSIEILKQQRKLSGENDWIFPTNKPDTPLSDAAFVNALKKMGYTTELHTPHGFRSTASTMLHEMSFPSDVIETQLAHKRKGVEGIYNRSHLLQQRREMLQSWANYLDQLRKGDSDTIVRMKAGTMA